MPGESKPIAARHGTTRCTGSHGETKENLMNARITYPSVARKFVPMWAAGIFCLACLPAASAQGHVTIKSYPPGSLSQWTHVADTPYGVVWYNAQTGAGAIGRMDHAGNHATLKSYGPGSFSLGWTHIVGTPTGILWYNAQTGAGAIGRIDLAGNHTTTMAYGPGAFATGWTNIVNTPGGILYYNADTGSGAVGLIR
jgi:streptogramin lyase